MSRSGPIGQAMRAAARRPQSDDLPTQPVTQPSPHWPPPYGEAPGQRAQQQPGYGAPSAQGYHFPQGAAEGDGFNRFPPAGEGGANFGYPPQGGDAPPFGFPHASAQQQPPAGPPWGQQGDARGFDLGNYMSAAGQGYGADGGQYDPPPFAAAPHGYGEPEAEFDEHMPEDDEEPRRGRRGLMIVVALVGAIGLGGGMAYAYKTLFPARTGPAPLIKDTQGPVKSKPEIADGRGFPHTDKKLLNRLGDDTGPQGAPGQASSTETQDDRVGDDPNAPRKVRLIPIAPNGGPPPVQVVTTTAPPAAPSAPVIALPPGVTIDNVGPPRTQQVPSAARAQLPPPAAAAPARPAPQPPVRIASAANMPTPAEAEPVAPVKKAPVAKAAATKNPVPKTKEASAASAVATASGAGYVAVLSSQKSRMDALKIFANMQEKYGEVLSSRTPDVQEANLGEKGVWYRLVVGPPGSREAAASLCTQLKAAGYSGCWVTAY
ncbi:MAG TPA: SPOR domain-containing protein [Hyphomicrobiaceae bacterium]|nr:SPOR domain-containing protein [Hyphomicrobiaceae bacterium]